MCGRYAFITPGPLSLKGLGLNTESYQNYNIAPGQIAPIVLSVDNKTALWRRARWGLIPAWVKDIKSFKAKTINARAESLKEKPSFRRAFEKRRCLVPASGYYEWQKSSRKVFFIKAPDAVMAFAGLYELWQDGDAEIYSFSIITTPANKQIASIHHRMPAILPQDYYQEWLNPQIAADEVSAQLKPYNRELISYEVDSRVGRVTENDAGLLEPIPPSPQGSLF